MRRLWAALKQAAPVAADAGLVLLLEPLNTRLDHPGYFLDSTSEGLDIVEEVDSPAVRLLYDLYHATMMGETAGPLDGRGHLIGHLHVADAPGRHEPGTGSIDWPARLRDVERSGYRGMVGLEYRPARGTQEGLAATRLHLAPDVAQRAWKRPRPTGRTPHCGQQRRILH